MRKFGVFIRTAVAMVGQEELVMTTEKIFTQDTLERFSFGKNWKNFLTTLNEDRIAEAENSLRDSLGLESLKELRFFYVGSGSGLFSLAAYRLFCAINSHLIVIVGMCHKDRF